MNEDLSSELVSALLALFAHDLRNPLSALHSNVSFLSTAVPAADSEAGEALEDVAASSDALGHITDNLELLSMALEGARPREAQELSLRDLLREAGQKSKRFAESYRVVMEVDSDLAGEIRVIAHREMLMRSLANLLRNGIQHAGETGRVSVGVRREGAEAVVSVVDTGSPLTEEACALAFTAQGQLSGKNVAGGRYSRGLGLYAARVAADLAGATVLVLVAAGGLFELRIRTS